MARNAPAPSSTYPLLQRGPGHRWWHPVVGLLLAALGIMVVAPLVLLPVLLVVAALEPGAFSEDVLAAFDVQQHVTPAGLLWLNLSLAAGVPLALLLQRTVHGLPAGTVSSVLGRVRWRFVWLTGVAAVVTLVLTFGLGLLVPEGLPGADSGPGGPPSSTVALALVLLLTTPLQAAGEEYLFRGYLMQAIGAITGGRVLSVIGSALIFAVAHGAQNVPLFVDRFAFGIVAGIAVVVTGGLEAGIAMHVLNNLVALGAALAFGDLTGSLTPTEASWWNLPLTLVQSVVFLALVVWLARRTGVATQTPAAPPELAGPGRSVYSQPSVGGHATRPDNPWGMG